MEKILSQLERSDMDQLISSAEKQTGAQIVFAVIRKCNSYSELPWKAFALGSSFAGLLVFILEITHRLPWNFSATLPVIIILCTGSFFTMLTLYCPPVARLFLSKHNTEAEMKKYAESVFLTNEFFKTDKRNGILILLGLYEKSSVILPDKGIAQRIDEHAISITKKQIALKLKQNNIYGAMNIALDEIVKIIGKSSTDGVPYKNELPNEIIEEKGI